MKSLYIDDFAVGQVFKSPAPRPVSEQTINAFAELSGDKNRIHVDADWAKQTPFGQKIAHGLLGLSIASGLLHDMGIIQESVVAFRGLEWRFKAPTLIGDSLSAVMTVKKVRALGAKGGLVVFDAVLTNQKGELLQEGEWTLMVKKAP